MGIYTAIYRPDLLTALEDHPDQRGSGQLAFVSERTGGYDTRRYQPCDWPDTDHKRVLHDRKIAWTAYTARKQEFSVLSAAALSASGPCPYKWMRVSRRNLSPL